MKRLLVITLAGLALFGFQTFRGDFSGNWALDLQNSSHLAPSFKMVKSYIMQVRVANDSMAIFTRMKGPDDKEVVFPPTMFRCDSTESFRDDSLRGVKRWIRAWWGARQTLTVFNRVVQTKGTTVLEYTQTDVWQAKSADTLLVSTTKRFEHNDSTAQEQRLFSRVTK